MWPLWWEIKLYESLIDKIADVLNSTDSKLTLGKVAIKNCVSYSASILQQLGFREDFVYDKIKSILLMKGPDITAISDVEN